MSSAATVLIVLAAVGRIGGPDRSADPAKPTPGHSLHGEAFDDGPRQRAVLLPGMGRVDFPVTTAAAEAQAFVNQGVAQLHSFYYHEAERSFRTASAIDPACPMAYWGMAMANVNNPKRAKGFLDEARARAAKATITPRERLYLDALSALHKEGGGDAGLKGWHRGLEAVIREAPGDLDARAWLALAIYQSGHIDSDQAVDIVLESVLKAEPTHPGAHHYRIHLWDHKRATSALGSAVVYARAAPGIAHAWHMPGHTYTELRRHADAAYHQEAAARVDHAAMARDRTMPFEIHNYAHNNQWLCTSLARVGRVKEAVAVARNLVDLPRDPDKNRADDPESAQRLGRLRWAEALARHELWDDLIAATESGRLDWSDLPAERLLRAYHLGLAFAAKGDDTKLAAQVAALKDLAEQGRRAAEAKPRKVSFELDMETASKVDQAEVARQVAEGLKRSAAGAASGQAPPAGLVRLDQTGHDGELTIEAALAELEGYQVLRRGEIGTAFVKFSKTTVMRPEARARAHLSVDNRAFAVTTAKAAIEKAPEEVAPLASYVEVMVAVGRSEEARTAWLKLDGLARRADRDLPSLRRLSSVVAGWGPDSGWSSDRAGASVGGDDLGRVDPTTLGPLTYSPFLAEPIIRPDVDGGTWTLAGCRGRKILLLFFLGGKCPHCLQQLEEFGKSSDSLRELGVDVVAIGTDSGDDMRALKRGPDKSRFPMRLLADPRLDLFKAYRSFDEFEGQPLHGAFLIDQEGRVRWRRVSADPFLDVEFIKSEARRLAPP